MIEGKALQKVCNEIPVASSIDFKLVNGEVYGVWDPSNTTVSAFLALLSGAMLPDSGQVRINGFDTVTDRVNARKCVGYMPRSFAPYDDMTPDEFLFFIAEARGLDYEDGVRVVQEQLEAAELAFKRRSLIANLTKLEKKRLCLAQALVGDPEILVLDDPFFGLTERDALDLLNRIDLLADYKTVFLGSRSLAVLRSICDRILVLSEGELLGIYEVGDDSLNALAEKTGTIAEADASLAQTRVQKKKRSLRHTKPVLKKDDRES